MAVPTLLTYRDLIDHLVMVHGAIPAEGGEDRASMAVQDAYRQLHHEHDWKYLAKHCRINLNAQQTDGTVVYDYDNNTLTLADSTWPSWARYGHIRIDNVDYKVAEIASGSTTVLTFDTIFRPQADVASTTYALWQAEYRLPADITRILELHDENGQWSSAYVTPNDWLAMSRSNFNTGRPFLWTITGAEDLYGSMSLRLTGPPTEATTLDFMYQRAPQALTVNYTSQGSARVTMFRSDTRAIISSGTTTAMVGSVFRLGSSSGTNPPGARGSSFDSGVQRIVQSVGLDDDELSATALTVDASMFSAFTHDVTVAFHFAISSPVDYPAYMLTTLKRRCEYEMAIRSGASERAEERAQQRYFVALNQAMEANNIQPVPRPRWWQPWWYHRDMAFSSGW